MARSRRTQHRVEPGPLATEDPGEIAADRPHEQGDDQQERAVLGEVCPAHRMRDGAAKRRWSGPSGSESAVMRIIVSWLRACRPRTPAGGASRDSSSSSAPSSSSCRSCLPTAIPSRHQSDDGRASRRRQTVGGRRQESLKKNGRRVSGVPGTGSLTSSTTGLVEANRPDAAESSCTGNRPDPEDGETGAAGSGAYPTIRSFPGPWPEPAPRASPPGSPASRAP